MRASNFILLYLLTTPLFAQEPGNRKLIIITFDGYRWKDQFRGADSIMLFPGGIRAKDSLLRIKNFWEKNIAKRREKAMPFFWKTIATKGQVYGNRDLGSLVNVKNRYWFSYPGYNEIFTGYPDTSINTNDYPPNPHVTVQEFINNHPAYKGSVAAFASWSAFDRILNEKRSGIPVNAGYEELINKKITEGQRMLNKTQFLLPKVFGTTERADAITYFLAKEYMMQNHPKVLQISFIETDAWGHRNNYYHYLESAQHNDAMLEDLWKYIQSDPFYKDQTTLFIATDHGRGDNSIKESENWTHHNSKVPEADQVWFAVMGPYTKALGEMKNGQVYQYQFAKTMAALLGIVFISPNPVGEVIEAVISR